MIVENPLSTQTSVAPLAGAWIEIKMVSVVFYRRPSLPSRERGLKLFNDEMVQALLTSLPSRERGLK